MTAPRSGDLIAGRYRLLSELGGGGMGVVFRAVDEAEARTVAVKIVRWPTPDASRRFQREARATEGLDEKRVARVYEVGETEDGNAYIVMEYVEGQTLRALLQAGAFDRPEALRIVREIAVTLGQAHASGLLHRDVKPDNVIVREDGRVVLLDFGIVKHLDRSDDLAHVTTQLTSEGTMIGTPAYLAPEQALGHEVGPPVDQFALAVTAFEMLTGRLPWTATDMTRMLAQLLAEEPPSVSTFNRGLPRQFDAVLARALSKAPSSRFPDVLAFVDAMDAAQRGELLASPASHSIEGPVPAAMAPAITPPTTRPSPQARPRSSVVLWLLASVLAVGGGAAVVRGRWLGAHAAGGPPASGPIDLGVSPAAPLGCPIFAVEGAPEIAPRLGAAAAALACARVKWFLGGSDEQVLTPAALLGAPVEPRQNLPDFLGAADARAKTLEIAKSRHLPTLDGTVTRGHDSWRVDLVARDAAGEEVAHVNAVEAPHIEVAIREATTRLWKIPPLAEHALDPDVARWTGYPDIRAGLLELDLTQVGAEADACRTIRQNAQSLGRGFYYLDLFCQEPNPWFDAGVPVLDAGAPVLDESSAPALLLSIYGVVSAAPSNPFTSAESTRLATELESNAGTTPSRFGRASLERLAGVLWSQIGDSDHAYAAALSSLSSDPQLSNTWSFLLSSARGAGPLDAVRSLASVWVPQEPLFFKYATSTRTDDLDAILQDAQLAYLLEPTARRTVALGCALAQSGRSEEVRALIASVPTDPWTPTVQTTSALLACIDLHDAMFTRALERSESGGVDGLEVAPSLASVLGKTGPVASAWATSFLEEPPERIARLVRLSTAVIALCMNAGGALAARCLARVETLAAGQYDDWGVGGGLFLRGAKRYAAGDARGAVDIWRPIVASPNDTLVNLLPTSAFERAGEPNLAARIDAVKMQYRRFAGVSEAAPREAQRAFQRGDRARARELATSVVHAWEVADVTIPAVADMRALLARVGN